MKTPRFFSRVIILASLLMPYAFATKLDTLTADSNQTPVQDTFKTEVPLLNKNQAPVVDEKIEEKTRLLVEQFISALKEKPEVKKKFTQRDSAASRFDDEKDTKLPNLFDDFYNQYLMTYYPKVFVIRDFFLCMSTKEIEVVLNDIVTMFARDPWLYFVNKAEKFNVGIFWEYVVDQCSFINDFLKKARVDLSSGKVFFPEKNSYARSHVLVTNKQTDMNLYIYLKKAKSDIVFDFYALCFDYLIKLFNEGVLMKDLKQVQRYFYELEFVIGRLRGSRYESSYQEAMSTCKELIDKLKRTLASLEDDKEVNENDDDYAQYDEQTRKMMREAKSLGYVS